MRVYQFRHLGIPSEQRTRLKTPLRFERRTLPSPWPVVNVNGRNPEFVPICKSGCSNYYSDEDGI